MFGYIGWRLSRAIVHSRQCQGGNRRLRIAVGRRRTARNARMWYLLHEASQLLFSPARMIADLTKLSCTHSLNPVTYTPGGRALVASCELFERTTRAYPKP